MSVLNDITLQKSVYIELRILTCQETQLTTRITLSHFASEGGKKLHASGNS